MIEGGDAEKMIIPGEFIQWEHGISGIAFCVNGLMWLVVGYLCKDLKCVKEGHKEQNELINKRIVTMEKCMAVMKERDEGYKNVLDDIKKDVGKLFDKMDKIQVAVAKLNVN